MSKELVISANRHETKVAILEDDQLVEIYFQRSNEYSLAGSIHKGRVTRVLPGMQSAFVDLGLERDTFLYVSDFFEENGDDIDRISLPEERPVVARAPQPARIEEPPPAPPVRPSEEPADAAEAVAAAPPVTAGGQPADRGQDRGRRSRRRRNRGRGFPDSKYAAAGDAPGESEREPVVEEPAPAIVSESSSFSVLPGESLAKYRSPSSAQEPEADEEDEAPVEDFLSTAAEPEASLPPDLAAIPNDNPEEEPPANAIPDAPQHAVAPQVEEEPEPEPAPVEQHEPAPEPDVEATAAGDRDDEDPEIQALILDSVHGDDEHSQTVAEPEDEEPVEASEAASGPASANVREQGPRYMHRMGGRRMRRRRGPEGDGPPAAQPPRPEPRIEARPEPPVEVRAEQRAPAARPEKGPLPSITDLLKEGQEILVQIAKEPLGQKGARITSHIALPGRYVVYMPTLDHMGVSRKIASDDERLRLKKTLQKHRAGLVGGFIIRTAGEGKTEEDIASDMNFLANLWLDIRQKAEKRPAPALLHHDLDLVQRILRDQVNDAFKSIWVDSEDAYESILRFLQRFQPAAVSRVKLYTRPAPVFDAFGVSSELEKALRPKVWLKSGGYIVINQTEALVAIDVNTGKYVGKSNRLEDTIVKTNTEAVKEIVRQVRLRDLGGIIVIDFIDMDERKNRQKVMQALEEAMHSDRAPFKILQFNDFGLVAITRKRVKQSLERTLCAPCPHCEGAGYVKSVQTIVGEILQEAHKIARAVEGQNVMLRVHPDVAKVLKSNQNKYLEELEEILKRPVLVTGDPALHHEKFDLA